MQGSGSLARQPTSAGAPQPRVTQRTSRRLAASFPAKAAPSHSSRPSPSSSEDARQPEAKPAGLINMEAPAVNRRQVVQSALAGMAFASCPCCTNAAKADDWDYENSGPNMWEGVCATGARQSPVNLPLGSAPGTDSGKFLCRFGEITFNYGTQERVVVLNTGHGTMQVNFKPGNTATIGGIDLELLQFHFHTPSEHAFDGKRTPMEVHLVHKIKSTGGLAVIGIMMESGATIPNPSVQTALVCAPSGAKEMMNASRPVDPTALLPADVKGHRPYIHYAGSLTTPPCSEGVDWFVLTTPIKVTDKQVLDFMHFVGAGKSYSQNARPVQSLGGRNFKFEL